MCCQLRDELGSILFKPCVLGPCVGMMQLDGKPPAVELTEVAYSIQCGRWIASAVDLNTSEGATGKVIVIDSHGTNFLAPKQRLSHCGFMTQ